MTSNTRSNSMQTTGTVLSWLVGYAVVVLLIIIGPFLRGNSSTGNQGHGPLEVFVNAVGPLLGLSVVAAALVAVGLCIVGIVRWPAQIIRSPRWVFSAIGVVLVLAAVVLIAALASFIAVQHP
jgi:hypothetical protein